MKEEILKRAMFAMPLSKEAQGTGIMSGFDMDEMEGDVDENADMEEMPPMARTPQNPEILMNTLRGDMRSVDARYMELAQMVGEEAAMETPPEVLAMLMGKMGAEQSGIGALPQGQAMAPPGMPPGAGMPPPDQMGAPQPAPAMPQGGIPMPEGMESAPPFSQGAEAPQGYAVGGLVRGAQFLGNKLGQFGSSANAALGRMFMTPQGISQPYLENVRGAGGRFTAEQVQRGGDLLQPTFTQGLQQGLTRLPEQYPRLSALVGPALGIGAGSAYVSGKGSGPGKDGMGSDMASQIPTDSAADLVKNSVLNQPAAVSMTTEKPVAQSITVANPSRYTVTPGKTLADMSAPSSAPSSAASDLSQISPVLAGEFGEFGYGKEKPDEKKSVADFIKDAGKKEAKEKSKVDRIREGRAEYEPLFAEILGDDKESAKVNALLLLSEAGLKLAGSRKPTFAMALADAASGLPRGFAAIAAQERELGVKGKMAALQQAIGDVESEDKYQQALRMKVLDIDGKILEKLQKANRVVYENVGAGGRIAKDTNGSYLGFGIDEKDPVYRELRENPDIVNNFAPGNPYARDLGKATTATRENPKSREAALDKFNKLSAQVANVDRALSMVENAFSPGTFVVNALNNLVVPVVPNFIKRPDVDTAATIAGLKGVFSDITRGDAEIGGKTSVQGEKWQRDTLKPVSDPDAFFKNPEIAAKLFQQRKTDYLNEMYRTGTELGIYDRNIVVTTPPTGTKNDPFVIPKGAEERQQMVNYLRSSFSTVRNPQSMINIRDYNGNVTQVSIDKFLNPRAGN